MLRPGEFDGSKLTEIDKYSMLWRETCQSEDPDLVLETTQPTMQLPTQTRQAAAATESVDLIEIHTLPPRLCWLRRPRRCPGRGFEGLPLAHQVVRLRHGCLHRVCWRRPWCSPCSGVTATDGHTKSSSGTSCSCCVCRSRSTASDSSERERTSRDFSAAASTKSGASSVARSSAPAR